MTERCCGTCRHYWKQREDYWQCRWAAPEAWPNAFAGHQISVHPHNGTLCRGWQEKPAEETQDAA